MCAPLLAIRFTLDMTPPNAEPIGASHKCVAADFGALGLSGASHWLGSQKHAKA